MNRNRGYMLPLDIIFYALYVRPAVIFLDHSQSQSISYCSFRPREANAPLNYIDGYQHSSSLLRQMTSPTALVVLTSDGTSVRLAQEGIPLKRSVSCHCKYTVNSFLMGTQTHMDISPRSFWTFCGLCLEILNIFLLSRRATHGPIHPEKPEPVPGPGANAGNTTGPGVEPARAMNGEQAVV